jgi:CRP/FNR family transcriptional regulator, cyclic AMP receptor protein
MNARPNPEAIAAPPFGAELDPADRTALAGIMTARQLTDGEVLIEEGHVDDALYLVAGGALAVTRNSGGGSWVTLQLLRKGDIAGEMGFIDGREHSATLRAVGATEIYSLRREDLESLLDSHPKMVYRVMRAIMRTVHAILLRMNVEFVELNNYIMKQHGRY